MSERPAPPPPRQPWLHDLSIVVDGNSTVLSAPSGDIEPGTAQGWYVDDRRVVSTLLLEVGDEPPTPVAARAVGNRAQFAGSARGLGNPGPDPTVEVARSRVVDAGLCERVTITSRADDPVITTVRLSLAGDGADIASVKSGHLGAGVTRPGIEHGEVTWADEWHRVSARTEPTTSRAEVGADGVTLLEVDLEIAPGGSRTVTLHVSAERLRISAFDADAGSSAVGWCDVSVRGADPRLEKVVSRALDDLRHLALRDPLDRNDLFFAAGSPWYLTLFGRDSLWSARMVLPLGVDVAHGTLRALARRQGRAHDAVTGEAPGKIPHELRRHVYVDQTTGMTLPQVYYGTVDATALWITLLVEAVDWGLPLTAAHDLLPHLQAAVGWLTGDGQPDDDGLLKYLDTTGTGLANQGWKDSGDSIRWRDGRVADAPIALVEAQAYAVEALFGAARLYRALGVAASAVEVVQAHAEALRDRLRAAFWVAGEGAGEQEREPRPYLAIALDGAGRPVDGVASNMGHVLGTGALSGAEARLVADTVTGVELLDEFGVRTFGTGNGGFNPVGYHTGSIWTHDTAVVAGNLAREGFCGQAAAVARTLLASAEAFGYRWPELYSGLPFGGAPTPYPASCRPQAWSAASAVVLLSVGLGLRPDAGSRTLVIRAPHEPAFGAMTVTGLRFCGGRVDLAVSAAGRVTVLQAPDDVTVRVEQG